TSSMTVADLRRRLSRILGYIVIIGAVLGYFVWKEHHRRRVVEDLGLHERKIVFDDTLESFRKLCVEHEAKAFGEYCIRQKHFLELFPECDQSCRELLAKIERGPTR